VEGEMPKENYGWESFAILPQEPPLREIASAGEMPVMAYRFFQRTPSLVSSTR
jgi:hypothetical protein